ncbi:hypothetical protein [Nocardioides ungokensis]|uniref:hypothetical protein n=1 Tax=Nocardioides ungokensis TaxID=1643322 RepID=UPI0015E00F76|nr:hypothetical protein [Nocardioides ungokensis]
MKHALIAATLVLVAGTTAGCGGSDGPPADASKDDFCGNFKSIAADMGKLGADAKDSDVVKAIKDAGSKLEDTGTPSGIPDDARKGFELEVKKIDGLDDNATKDDLDKLGSDLSDTEQKQVDAFNKYVDDTCGTGDSSSSQ